ncbi:phage tail family protein, partial [Bacillus pseudomycoides]|nr:phage tail family protein [Bacillus pseudomycoides]
KSGADLQKLKEDLAGWLITEEAQELVFDAEPDRIYLAVVDETFDPEELVNIGQGVITFICPMPYKLGKEQTATAKLENNQLKLNIQNTGTKYSNPKFTITVANPSTFFDIINKNGDQYFRMGYPVKIDETPLERNELAMWDQMSSMVGWTEATKVEGGTVSGKMKTNGYQFLAESYGTGTTFHGPTVKKSIPKGPLQDFIMQAHIRCMGDNPVEMGRVEIALLDESSNVVTKISMNDLYWQAEQNLGSMVIGAEGHPKRQTLIYESGDKPTVWNKFYGRLWIARVGDYWEAYISKFTKHDGKDESERFATWRDVGKDHMNTVAQVQIHIGQWGSTTPCNLMTIDDLKIWKVNQNTQRQIPYIVEVGDIVEVDTKDASIRINGKDAIYTKDFMSDYITIEKGQNDISFLPADIGQVEVSYRERYL